MSETISLINGHVFVFIVVFILSLIIISIYIMITPELDIPYKFDPFPNETPSALPDPTGGVTRDKCFSTLTACDSNGQCNSCDITEYECKNVKTDNMYSFNGINVPVGNWCLRKDNNPNPQCNPLTGRWIWTFDPDYCGNHGGNTQCWKCHCLYPNMYSGEDTGCETQIGCQNDSSQTILSGLQQNGNILKPTSCAPKSINGCVWGPNGSTQNGCENISQLGPYDQDMSGNPLFSCACNDTSSQQYFTTLPNDPYSCHLEPCFAYMNSTSKGLQCNTDSCGMVSGNCSCNCPTNFAKSPSGNYQGTCVLVSGSCGPFAYNEQEGKCMCGEGPYWERKCKSVYTGVNMDNTDIPDCKDPQNALGSECFNPCEGVQCKSGSPCISCGPTSYQTVSGCNLSPNGLLLAEDQASIPHSYCDCSQTTTTVPSGYAGFGGQYCDKECLADNSSLKSYLFGNSKGDCNCNCCCSQDYQHVDKFWIISTELACKGDWPTKDNPGESLCSPIADNCTDVCNT